MSDATIASVEAGLEALLALAGTTQVIPAPLAAALIAGIKTLKAHAAGHIDSATMMASITTLDAAIAADNTAADTALDAKFKGA